jgi:hypothetical protein
MKDVTSTSFGLVIAFLLPGLACLYGLSFWHTGTREVLQQFLKADANAGLFLLVLLGSLSLGLLLSPFRYYLYEELLWRKDKLHPSEFSKLGEGEKLAAFRAAVDEHLRYHQFWGGMSIAIPISYLGWLRDSWASFPITIALSLLAFCLIEWVTGKAALRAYELYVTRARQIMKGE